LAYISAADSMGLSSFVFRGGLRKHVHIETNRSRSFEVIDFGTNRKDLCDFLLVRHSNLGLILPRFRYIAGFLFRD